VKGLIIMKTSILTAAISVVVLISGDLIAQAAPLKYELPPETAALKPGPNQDVAQNNCTACHSADYVQTQPRGPKFKRDFWQAEVTKMIKVYGAPIDDADAAKIVDYLTAAY
jgi:mono/diheme cytochrome c family protein